MKNHFCRWKKMCGKWAAGLLLLLWLVGGISVGLFVEKSEPDSLKAVSYTHLALTMWGWGSCLVWNCINTSSPGF